MVAHWYDKVSADREALLEALRALVAAVESAPKFLRADGIKVVAETRQSAVDRANWAISRAEEGLGDL